MYAFVAMSLHLGSNCAQPTLQLRYMMLLLAFAVGTAFTKNAWLAVNYLGRIVPDSTDVMHYGGFLFASGRDEY